MHSRQKSRPPSAARTTQPCRVATYLRARMLDDAMVSPRRQDALNVRAVTTRSTWKAGRQTSLEAQTLLREPSVPKAAAGPKRQP